MSLYPLDLDRLEWAARRELVMTMREARGITAFAARFIGCSTKKLRVAIGKFQIDPEEYGGEPFPEQQRMDDDDSLRAVVRAEILKVLAETNWNKRRTAELLGIGRQTLYNRMEKLQISLDA